MKSFGYTESGLSTRDIIRHCSTDNTSKPVSILFHWVYLLLLHRLSNPGYFSGIVVMCADVSLNWGQPKYAYLAKDQTRRLDSSPLPFPSKVQTLINANTRLLLCMCRCVLLGAVGCKRWRVEYSRETLVGDSSSCKVNRISSWRSREVLLKAPADNTLGIINGNG